MGGDLDSHLIPGPIRVLNPNGISIGSAVFVGLTGVTDRPTDHATQSVTIGHIYVRSTAMWPNNTKDNVYDAVVMAKPLRMFSVSSDECRVSARWPPTLKPSQSTWPVSLLVGCYHPHPPTPFISIS